jgi:N-acetylgalactosamine-6-sulfatase
MTGRFTPSFQKYPAQHGFDGAVTVTELLRRLGYRTGHVGKWHIGPVTANGTYGIDSIKVLGGNRRDPRGRDAVITDEAIAFVRANKDRPFYLNVWYHTPHNPVNPPRPFVDRFNNVRIDPADFKGPYMRDYLLEQKKAGENIELELRKRLGDLVQLDEQVARLLRALGELGLSEDTIVAFTSDNGPNPFGYAGIFRGRKHVIAEGGVRQPLLVRWPGHVTAGREDERSVLHGVDWLPTLVRLAGGKIDPKDAKGLVGEDVSDVWLGKERPRTTDLFWKVNGDKKPTALRRGDWKFYVPGTKKSKGSVMELYDLAKDPSETTNLASHHPKLVRELTVVVERWKATLPKRYLGSEKEKEK